MQTPQSAGISPLAGAPPTAQCWARPLPNRTRLPLRLIKGEIFFLTVVFPGRGRVPGIGQVVSMCMPS